MMMAIVIIVTTVVIHACVYLTWSIFSRHPCMLTTEAHPHTHTHTCMLTTEAHTFILSRVLVWCKYGGSIVLVWCYTVVTLLLHLVYLLWAPLHAHHWGTHILQLDLEGVRE
jgi:hypothetical protein